MKLVLTLAICWASILVVPHPAIAAGRDCGSTHGSTQVGGGGNAIWANGQQTQTSVGCSHPVSSGTGAYVDVLEELCELGGATACNDPGADCDGNGGRWHLAQWVHADGHTSPAPSVCVPAEQDPAPQVTGVRMLEAFRSVPLPTPTLGMSPPDGVTLVNLPTIFYTRAEPFGRDVRVLGRRVHLEIAPVSYSWSVGQGGEFETSWPGSPYRRGVTPQDDPDAYVTWAYGDAGATEAARVRVVWGATWSLDGRPMGRVPGTVEMTSPAATVTVKEAWPVLTGS